MLVNQSGAGFKFYAVLCQRILDLWHNTFPPLVAYVNETVNFPTLAPHTPEQQPDKKGEIPEALFDLGQMVVTPGALEGVNTQYVRKFTSLEGDTTEIRRNSPSMIDNSLE